MIALIDYGVGNVQAFLNMFKRLGIEACRASTPEALQQASHLILPGVGAFDHAMAQLQQSGLRPALEALVLLARTISGTETRLGSRRRRARAASHTAAPITKEHLA